VACLLHNHMTNDAARPDSTDSPIEWETLARYLAGECSVPERERIERYLADHPGDSEVVSALDNAMRILALREAPEIDVESALERVIARRDAPDTPVVSLPSRRGVPPRVKRTIVGPWRIASVLAAAAVVVLAARTVLQRYGARREGPVAGSRTYVTAVGKRDSLRLPDGGRVVLGPASSLTIARGYGDRVRQVNLHGEAYFDVVHDSTRPFVVVVGPASIRDVGTSFAVHQDGARVRVVVTSGSVLLHSVASSARQDTLNAGDVGTLEPDGGITSAHDVATTPYLSWMHGSLVYRDAPLAEVSQDLRRWYGVTLRVEDSTMARRHFSGSFNGDPVDRVLRVIGISLGARVELRGDTAVLRPRTR
jgi:transmembrane sensor